MALEGDGSGGGGGVVEEDPSTRYTYVNKQRR